MELHANPSCYVVGKTLSFLEYYGNILPPTFGHGSALATFVFNQYKMFERRNKETK